MVLGRQIESSAPVTRLKQLLFYLAVFFAVRAFTTLTLQLIAIAWGLPQSFITELLSENEVGIQALALLSAAFAGYRYKDGVGAAEFFKKLLPWSRPGRALTPGRVIDLCTDNALKGFLLASVGMAVSVFLGLVRFDRMLWDLTTFLSLLPLSLLQALVFTAWILGLELSRRFLLRTLAESQPAEALMGRWMLVAFEAHLWFLALDQGVTLSQRLIVIALCALLSASLLFWTEQGLSRPQDEWRLSTRRATLLLGFWIGLFHVYGYSLANYHGFSLVYSLAGPASLVRGWGTNAPLFSFAVLMLLLVWFSNASLRKEALRLMRSVSLWVPRSSPRISDNNVVTQ
jgi:hypothetical protein